jgi:hypothetical protein
MHPQDINGKVENRWRVLEFRMGAEVLRTG